MSHHARMACSQSQSGAVLASPCNATYFVSGAIACRTRGFSLCGERCQDGSGPIAIASFVRFEEGVDACEVCSNEARAVSMLSG